MLFVPVTRPESLQHIPDQVDGVEYRLDYNLGLKDHKCSKPVLFTVRSVGHGGKFQRAEQEALIEQVAALKPDYLDLEYDMRPAFLQKKRHSKIVLSYHNFQETPDLEPIYHAMSKYPAHTYKIACLARSTNDALRMLLFAKSHDKVSVIPMGEYGEFARILGPVVGNIIDFASLDEATAPGQLSVQDLETYRYRSLNPKTALYGLIGDPIDRSQGHIYHNDLFAKRGINAVYVKMVVKELPEFFRLARQLGFCGLSVTMPLKEKVMPFLDEVDPKALQIGAVNTIVGMKGYNTDGVGALDAIGDVKDKRVVLLGAGGAARAIAFEAKARGSHVTILNRTVEKARDLAKAVGCNYGPLTEVPSHYDILVNCSPDPMPIDPEQILPTARVMDIVYVPRETEFLRAAASRGCKVIYGEQMFWNQAAAQTKLWF